jgi:hypothetical protein
LTLDLNLIIHSRTCIVNPEFFTSVVYDDFMACIDLVPRFKNSGGEPHHWILSWMDPCSGFQGPML